MLGAVCHDFGKPATTAFVDGRIRSIGHEEAGVAPATAFLDRLNIHSLDGVDVRKRGAGHRRAPPEARDVAQGAGGSRRRRVSPPGAEGESGAARDRCEGRLHRPHRRSSTAPRWTGSSTARGRWAWSIGRPRASFWAVTSFRWGSRPVRRWADCCRPFTNVNSMERSRRRRRGSRSRGDMLGDWRMRHERMTHLFTCTSRPWLHSDRPCQQLRSASSGAMLPPLRTATTGRSSAFSAPYRARMAATLAAPLGSTTRWASPAR